MGKMWPEWEYAKGVVNSARVGSWVRLTRKASRAGVFRGRARSDWGRVIRKDPPVGLLILKDGLKRPTHYFAGLWSIPRTRRPR